MVRAGKHYKAITVNQPFSEKNNWQKCSIFEAFCRLLYMLEILLLHKIRYGRGKDIKDDLSYLV